MREGSQVRVRAVCKAGAVPEGAELVDNATLEEAYLSFMVARDRVDVARTEETEEEQA